MCTWKSGNGAPAVAQVDVAFELHRAATTGMEDTVVTLFDGGLKTMRDHKTVFHPMPP